MRAIRFKPVLAACIILCGSLPLSASGQTRTDAKADNTTSAAESSESARRKVLEGDEWRRTRRDFDEWLSVQTIYGPDEIASIKATFSERISTMSAAELRIFMKDMQSRLEVLLSPEAEDAREWLSQFMSVAANPERQLGRTWPDVVNMTASQIRQELAWLRQKRESRQRAHTASGRTREMQAQRARDARSQQQAAVQSVDRSSWPANNPRRPSQYAPQPELRPQPLPAYVVSPWGNSIYWPR